MRYIFYFLNLKIINIQIIVHKKTYNIVLFQGLEIGDIDNNLFLPMRFVHPFSILEAIKNTFLFFSVISLQLLSPVQ